MALIAHPALKLERAAAPARGDGAIRRPRVVKPKAIWIAVIGLLLAAGIVAGGLVLYRAQSAKAGRFVTAPVSTGAISREITASGSVNPVVNVQVGAFVSGNIQALYCDYNTRVRKGQLCAKIDPKPYETTVAKAVADLDTQRAQLGKDRAGRVYAALKLKRALTLKAQGFATQDTVDSTQSADDQALAQIRFDQAQIRQNEAALRAAQINLDYTNILSPVDGTVVSRNVNVGQTVAASFQTPTLFLIAQDLTKMQVDTNVSESDIGGAAPGAAAEFTVEAYPTKVFRGRVAQVRQAPVSVQNVITYDVVVAADNPDLLLKPGMTATAKIIVARKDNVLRVPVQALHFSPSTGSRPAHPAGQARQRRPGAAAAQRVWILRDGKPVPVRVGVGLDDDAYAQITSGELKAGDAVIISEATTGQKGAARRNAQGGPVRLGL